MASNKMYRNDKWIFSDKRCNFMHLSILIEDKWKLRWPLIAQFYEVQEKRGLSHYDWNLYQNEDRIKDSPYYGDKGRYPGRWSNFVKENYEGFQAVEFWADAQIFFEMFEDALREHQKDPTHTHEVKTVTCWVILYHHVQYGMLTEEELKFIYIKDLEKHKKGNWGFRLV